MALTEQYVFIGPFNKDEPTNHCSDQIKSQSHLIYDDPDVLSAAAQMKRIFLDKKECLIHGDLHTGSVMVKESNAKVENGCMTSKERILFIIHKFINIIQ